MTNIPGQNTEEFYREEIDLKIDRLSMLAFLSLCDLALRHPEMPASTKKIGVQIGKQFLERLLDDGMFIQADCLSVYKQTFGLNDEDEKDEP